MLLERKMLAQKKRRSYCVQHILSEYMIFSGVIIIIIIVIIVIIFVGAAQRGLWPRFTRVLDHTQ
jgi:hypothetical protein